MAFWTLPSVVVAKISTDFFDNSDQAYAVAIQMDGKIIVAGSSGSDFALAWYNSNGILDSTFGTDGIVITDIDGSNDERGRAVTIQTDGKIVVAGSNNEGSAFALIRYEGDEGDEGDDDDIQPNMDGYNVTSELWAKAVLQVPGSPVTLVWREVGSDTTPSGDKVVSGYFYADPNDFAFGSVFNPELFVKIYIASSGWSNMAFNHVTVDDVTVFSAHNYNGAADKTGTATLNSRLVEHQYDGVGLQ